MDIDSLIKDALRCECGGSLTLGHTANLDMESFIPNALPWCQKIPTKVTGADCLRCASCGRQLISDETKQELLDVLMLSVAHSWRRLYPEDIAFVRARLGLGKTEFERKIGVPEDKLKILEHPNLKEGDERFYFPIEEHHAYISDERSNCIKLVAMRSISENRQRSLMNKWLPQTILSGEHHLVTRAHFARSSTKLKQKLAKLTKSIGDLQNSIEQWLTFWTQKFSTEDNGWADARQINESTITGIEIGKYRIEASEDREFSLFVLKDGGYAFVSENSEPKIVSADQVIKKIMGGGTKNIWIKKAND